MAEKTGIEWCDHTFNPWVGCTKVSAACDHCYAEGWAKRAGTPELWNGSRRRTTEANWKQPLKWNAAAGHDGVRRRVFCASLADVFDNQVPMQWRRELFDLIANCPNLDWLLLTKRPQNIQKMLYEVFSGFNPSASWPHIWLGTTVESPDEYRRIEHLRRVPAPIRFLSMEPLLAECPDIPLDGIAWVITGGESGAHARPSHPDWFRSIRDQCAASGVKFLHKQNGEFAPGEIAGDFLNPEKAAKGKTWTGSLDGWHDAWSEPDGHIDDEPDVYRVGKKRAGRLLDGVEHNQFPEPRT